LVEVRLETGRRNQIRIHLADLGHPILGDPRYRRDLATHRAWPYRRIALHAESLGFVHPTTGLPLRFVAQWPQEFRDCQRGVSSHRKGGKEGRSDRSDRSDKESQGD
jgi:23S rRNA pseudouridine1911/1915/1917 synthase